jgi:nucleolar protein 56
MRGGRRHFLVLCYDGITILDDRARVLKRTSSPRQNRAGLLRSVEAGRSTQELRDVLSDLPRGTLVVESEPLKDALRDAGWRGGIQVEFPSLGGRAVRRARREMPGDQGAIWDLARQVSASKVKESYENWDSLVVQAVNAIDELDRSMANIYARCREWNSIGFPELEHIIKNEQLYAGLLLQCDPKTDPLPEDIPEETRERITEAAGGSVGVDLAPEDLEAIRELALSLKYLNERKEKIQEYLSRLMEKNAPNLTRVAEPGVGARLIARAGSARKLALMPSTSVQTLGAEKALFRHITKGARPPKHGIIFQHPYVRNTPREVRGKVASILASKISLAIRTDYISGENKADELRSSLDSAVKSARKSSG